MKNDEYQTEGLFAECGAPLCVYLCDYSKLSIEDDFRKIINRLNKEAAARIMRFHRETDRYLAFVREVMLSAILHTEFGEENLLLEHNEYGNPFLKDRDFLFSISHSGSLVVISCGTVNSGIDVQKIGEAGDIASLCFMLSEDEQGQMKNAKDAEREFYRIWTWHEALSKEEGIGLTLFDQCQVRIDYEKKDISLDGRKLYFCEYEYPGYQLTLCAEKPFFPETVFTVDTAVWRNMAERMGRGLKYAKEAEKEENHGNKERDEER